MKSLQWTLVQDPVLKIDEGRTHGNLIISICAELLEARAGGYAFYAP